MTTAPWPPSRLGAVSLPIPHPSRRLRHLNPRHLGASTLVPHFSDQSYAPVDDLWGTKSKDVRLIVRIVRTISFQDFQPKWSWSTNVTDRQTDRRTTDSNGPPYVTQSGKIPNYAAVRWTERETDESNLNKLVIVQGNEHVTVRYVPTITLDHVTWSRDNQAAR